ncbi:MAG: amidohydrolase family protein [Clostridium sp.]
MKRTLITLGLTFSLALSLVGCKGADTSKSADVIFTGGNIYTMEKDSAKVESLAVKDGKIVALGSNADVEALKSENTKVVDLKGKTLLPGFIDGHTHAANSVEVTHAAKLSDGESLEDYVKITKEYAEKSKDKNVILGAGWIVPLVHNDANPKSHLDKISKDKPIILIGEDRHTIWLNSKALEMAGVTKDYKEPQGGKIGRLPNGEPNGILYETAAWSTLEKLPGFSKEDIKASLEIYDKLALERGVTQINHILMYNQKVVTEALLELEKEGKLNVVHYLSYSVFPHEGVNKMPYIKEVKEKLKGEYVKFLGIKIFNDGVLEGETAQLVEDYTHKPGYKGFSIWKAEDFKNTVKAYDKEKITLHIHNIGDAATKYTLDAIEEARKENGNKDLRHKITHLQLVKEEDIKRMADLNIIAVPQPNWAYKEDAFYKQAVEITGQKRADAQYPLNSLFKAGITVSSASDFPVTIEWAPLEGIEVGVTRCALGDAKKETLLNSNEAASVENMVKSYTINGAYGNYSESTTGSLKVGKDADLVVLDKDIFTIPNHQIATSKVLQTYNNGKEVYNKQ